MSLKRNAIDAAQPKMYDFAEWVKTGFCPENSHVYSGTKRSTTSEGLRGGDTAVTADHDVRKRKGNIEINKHGPGCARRSELR